jgi:hypothetical protein
MIQACAAATGAPMLAALADVDAIVNTTQHATTIRNQGAHARICGKHARS